MHQVEIIKKHLFRIGCLIKTSVLAMWKNIYDYCKGNWPTWRIKSERYARLTRLNKPIGIFLLLWPTYWGLWIAAEGLPDMHILVVFTLGVILMRSAGCVLNDIADSKLDKQVERTRTRPIATGEVRTSEALIVAFLIILIAFLLVLTMNLLTIKLAFVAVFLAAVYPFMKRYTYMPQFVLGLAFGWSIPMAFAAQTNSIPNIAWVLLIANVLWSVAYDTMYAMVDREDDLKAGVKSTAILFDDADRIIIAIIQLMVMVTLVLAGQHVGMDWIYYIALIIAYGFFIYQLTLIWQRQPNKCFNAFLNNNCFGLTVFLGIMINYLLE